MTPIEVLNEKGIHDAIKHLNNIQGHDKETRLLSVFAAKQVQQLMSEDSKKAVDVSERYANGLATEEELKNARAAAYAVYAAACAYTARGYAAYAADAAARAVYAAAVDAVYAAAAAVYAAAAAARVLNSKEQPTYWQAIEAKFREIFEEKSCTQL